jgi:hypothetical protein
MWRNRDREQPAKEPSAEDPNRSDSTAEAVPESEPSAAEPAPAFWRAQGQPPGTPEPARAAEPAEAPAVSESPAGAGAAAPLSAEEVVVIDAETAVKDPALTEAAHDPAVTDVAHEPSAAEVPPAAAQVPPAAAPPPAAATAPGSPGSVAPQRWSEILATFVDDPRGSVKMAADAVDSAIEEIVTSVRARQQALASSWQDSGADTEQLRSALREYRSFGAQIQRMSPGELTGQMTAGQVTAGGGTVSAG